MQINKEADFVLKGNKVLHPPVPTDGLELYYDTKGKKNTDTYKNRMLDMSGNDRHGELHNFNYKNLSGYQEDSELVFDGIDDKLVLGDVEKPEIISATKNLFDGSKFEIHNQSGDVAWSGTELTYKRANSNAFSGALYRFSLDTSKNYTLSFRHVSGGEQRVHILDSGNGLVLDKNNETPITFKPTTKETSVVFTYKAADHSGTTLADIQLEEGSVATPYVPYIPTAKITYQLNNNIISYEEDGTVKWVKDGKVMERKGINLVRNGNFYEKTKHWSPESGDSSRISNYEISFDGVSQNYYHQNINIDVTHKYFVSMKMTRKESQTSRFGVSRSTFGYSVILNQNKDMEIKEYMAIVEPTTTDNALRVFVGAGNTYSVFGITNIQFIDLTTTFGAGNEPTLEEIQAEPDKWQWLPNPLDLVETKELKGNILGDMEGIIDDHTRDEQSGVEVFTDKADDSLVRVEADGKSIHKYIKDKSLSFDSSSRDYVETNFYPSSEKMGQNFTWEFWNNYKEFSNNSGSHGSASIPRLYTQISSTGEIRIAVGDWFVGAMRAPSTNEWIHIAVTFNNGTVKCYMNGELQNTYTGVVFSGTSSSDYSLGRGFDNTRHMNGLSTEHRIWKRTFSENEIKENMFKRLSGYEDDLLFYMDTNEGEGNTVHDRASNYHGVVHGATWSEDTPSMEGELHSPDYPIEIHSLNDFDVVSSVGKRNYVQNNNNTPITMRMPDRGWAYNVYDIDLSPRYPRVGDKYYISADIENDSGINGNGLYLRDFTSGYNGWNNNHSPQEKIGHINTINNSNVDKLKIVFRAQGSAGSMATAKNIYATNLTEHFGEGNEPSLDWCEKNLRYTPNLQDITENDNHALIDKINISLSEPLRSVGDVKDRLFRDSDGLWKIERNVEEWEVNEGHTSIQSTGDDFIRFRLGHPTHSSISSSSNAFASTHLPYSRNMNGTEEINNGGGNNTVYVWLKTDRFDTPDLDGFRKWIVNQRNNGTPFIILYGVRYPTIEILDEELQNKLNNLRSFQESNYVYTVINEVDDLPSHISENLKPTIHTKFLAHDHYKESGTVNNLLIWNRSLEDEELLNQNKLFHERFNMKSNTIKGEPINQEINLTQGGYAANTLSLEYTIEI